MIEVEVSRIKATVKTTKIKTMKPRTKIKVESNIDTEKLKLAAFEGATSAFSNLSIAVNNLKKQQKLRRKQKFFFILFWVIVFSVVAGIMNKVTAQTSDNLIVLGGYKSIEAGYVFENEDFLNFGYSIAIQDSKIAEHRANRNDIYNRVHEFNDKVVPAGFALIGASFRPITITGKIGAAYLSQRIDGIQDKQKIYFAVGLMLSHELNESFSIVGSYDNISSAQVGLIYKF